MTLAKSPGTGPMIRATDNLVPSRDGFDRLAVMHLGEEPIAERRQTTDAHRASVGGWSGGEQRPEVGWLPRNG